MKDWVAVSVGFRGGEWRGEEEDEGEGKKVEQ